MGGGKSRRHTAKTGDKSLYSNREQSSQIVERNNQSKVDQIYHSDDLIYDEVDQFHNNDYLRLDHDMDDEDDSDDDGIAEEEVMRLENEDDDDDSEDDEDDNDEEGDEDEENEDDEDDDDEEERVISSDEDDDGDDETSDNVRDWGAKKMAYYYGDTADLEIGQEVEEALLEEDAAKDVLNARYQDMTEDDFMIDDDNKDYQPNAVVDGNIGGITTSATTSMNMTLSRLLQLSTKEKRQLLNQQHHQEFIPLLSYFTQKMIVPYTNTTRKVTNAIFYSKNDDNDDFENTADSIGATKLGQQYLLSKAMIQASATLNLIMYLLLKTEQAANAGTNGVDPALIQSHPVMQHLEKLNSLHVKFEEGVEKRVPKLLDQLETLAKAADSLSDPTLMQDSDDSDADGSDSEDDINNEVMEGNAIDINPTDTSKMLPDQVATESDADDDDDDDDDEVSGDEDIARRITLNEARFGIRPNEMQNLRQTNVKAERRRKKHMMYTDAGDDDIDNDIQLKKSGQFLATTLNTIEQRSSTNQKRSKQLSQHLVEQIDDINDEDGDGELRRGLAMMEEALGAPSDNDDDDDDEEKNELYDPELDGQDDYDNDGDDFYSKMLKKSKAAKDERKQRYAVAPKFPRVENDIVGDRTASKQILKNRGLVAHKAKINRNPRVKHREKFRQANKRRAGTVQAIRSPIEGHNYGGEATGISTNVIRSRKLG